MQGPLIVVIELNFRRHALLFHKHTQANREGFFYIQSRCNLFHPNGRARLSSFSSRQVITAPYELTQVHGSNVKINPRRYFFAIVQNHWSARASKMTSLVFVKKLESSSIFFDAINFPNDSIGYLARRNCAWETSEIIKFTLKPSVANEFPGFNQDSMHGMACFPSEAPVNE